MRPARKRCLAICILRLMAGFRVANVPAVPDIGFTERLFDLEREAVPAERNSLARRTFLDDRLILLFCSKSSIIIILVSQNPEYDLELIDQKYEKYMYIYPR